jgi:hypothetical protein
MTAVGDTLLLFGGKMKNGSLSNQLWQYNISGEKFASALSTVSVFRIRRFQKHPGLDPEISTKRNIQVLFGNCRSGSGSGSAWICIIFGGWIRILFRIKVKSCIRIRKKGKYQEL